MFHLPGVGYTFTAKNIGVGVILLISRSVFLLVESTIVAFVTSSKLDGDKRKKSQ